MWNSRTLFTHIHSCEDISCVAHIHESRLVATPRPPSRPTPSTDGSRDRPRPRWLRSRDGSRLVATPRTPSLPTPSTDGSRDRPRPRWLRWLRSRDGEERDSERARESTTHCVERRRATSSDVERARAFGRSSVVGRSPRSRAKEARAGFQFPRRLGFAREHPSSSAAPGRTAVHEG